MMEERVSDKKSMVQFLTVQELAKRLKLSPHTIRKQWRRLGGFKVLGAIRFDWERTFECIRQRTEEETPFALSSHGRLVKPPRDRRQGKTIYELIPDRHGLLGPPGGKVSRPKSKKKPEDERR